MESEDRGINRPIRGIPNVHVPRVSAGPDISGLSDNSILWPVWIAWVSGSGVVAGVLGYVN